MTIDAKELFAAGNGADEVPAHPGPDLPPLVPELSAHLHGLYHSPAPAFPTNGTTLRAGLKRAMNMALNAVGLSQRRFNQALLETLTLVMAEVRGLRAWVEERAPLLPSAPDLAASLDMLRREVAGLRAGVEHLRDHVGTSGEVVLSVGRRQAGIEAEQGARLHELTTSVEALGQRLQELHGAQEDVRAWFGVLQQKYEGLSVEARAIVEERSVVLPVPHIVDPAAYARRIAGMRDGLLVNLGCGELPWADYVNVDLRPLAGVDVVADVRGLPFEPGSLAEVASAHLVEHFREHQMRTRIIPYWKSLLRSGGRLRIICPDWGAMLLRVGDGRLALSDFKVLTFGLQDYDGDDHLAMYTPETLMTLLRACGFERVEVVARDRLNGRCPEMELVGTS